MPSEPYFFSENLDVIGHKCPVPVLRVRRLLERLRHGTILRVMASDPMTQIDFPHFCQESGHDLLEMTQENGIFFYLIRKSGEAKGKTGQIECEE